MTNLEPGNTVSTELVTPTREKFVTSPGSKRALTMEIEKPRPGTAKAVAESLRTAHENATREDQPELRAKLYNEKKILDMAIDEVIRRSEQAILLEPAKRAEIFRNMSANEVSFVLEEMTDRWEQTLAADQNAQTKEYNDYFYPVDIAKLHAAQARGEDISASWDTQMIANREMSISVRDLVAAGKDLDLKLVQEAARK